MDSRGIEELKAKTELNPSDSEAWYGLGMAYYDKMEWMKALECFKTAEITILNRIGEKHKNMGDVEASFVYFIRAQNVHKRPFKLAPGGSNWLQNLLIVMGTIALINIPFVFILPIPLFLFPILILLCDLLIFIILLPIAIVKSISSKKRETSQFLSKLKAIEAQIEAIHEAPGLSEGVKFIQLENLKQKRAKMAQGLVQRAYTESLTSRR